MEDPKQIVESIRKERFGIGLNTETLAEDVKAALNDKEKILDDAARLATEINTKKPQFIFELVQNAEDNDYEKGIEPKIKFIVKSNSLVSQNNERGFDRENVWALCGIGGTTKTKVLGYIGEKGIGFKSVFMVTDEPHIYSNGFQFKFKHDKAKAVSIIIPEWIDEIPEFIEPSQTNIILPLKPEVRSEIGEYIEQIHPSLLLFLRKLKIIEVEDENQHKYKKIELHEEEGKVEIVYGEKRSYWH